MRNEGKTSKKRRQLNGKGGLSEPKGKEAVTT